MRPDFNETRDFPLVRVIPQLANVVDEMGAITLCQIFTQLTRAA